MTDLDIIRQACIKANPEIIVNKNARLVTWNNREEHFVQYRAIRLADVLLAMYHTCTNRDYKEGIAYLLNFGGLHHWNLRTDDLSQQSPGTLKFLADLLRV